MRVSAAASLGDVLKAMDAAFETQSGIHVELNLGASSTLARQIEAGAPIDVFFSADLAKMDGLEKLGLIDSTTKRTPLSNALVVVVPADSALQLRSGADLAAVAVKQIAIADPKAVPAGIYAREWLSKVSLWSALESKFVATENVRAALAAVESGNVEAGIVYKTDAAISKKVKVAFAVPAPDAPQIVYPIALVKDARNADLARRYIEFIVSKEAAALFEQFGFIVLPQTPASR